MQRIILIALPILVWTQASLGQAPWTETFDNGVGRFNITTGQGDTAFVHDPIDENIQGSFIRQPTPDGRWATLGDIFTQSDVITFSVEWAPLSGNSDGLPLFGFRDSQYAQFIGVEIRNGYWKVGINTGSSGGPAWDLLPGDFTSWEFGQSYRIDFTFDGPENTIVFEVSQFLSGDFISQASVAIPIGVTNNWQIDRVGMFNTDDSAGTILIADIDNFSFVPEPSTAFLLPAATLLVLRRRRRPSA